MHEITDINKSNAFFTSRQKVQCPKNEITMVHERSQVSVIFSLLADKKFSVYIKIWLCDAWKVTEGHITTLE